MPLVGRKHGEDLHDVRVGFCVTQLSLTSRALLQAGRLGSDLVYPDYQCNLFSHVLLHPG